MRLDNNERLSAKENQSPIDPKMTLTPIRRRLQLSNISDSSADSSKSPTSLSTSGKANFWIWVPDPVSDFKMSPVPVPRFPGPELRDPGDPVPNADPCSHVRFAKFLTDETEVTKLLWCKNRNSHTVHPPIFCQSPINW